MTRRAALALAVPAVSLAVAGGVASATLPPDDSGGTDFVRRQAEAAVIEEFAADDPLGDVACAPPPEDTAGAQMLCYGTNGAGNVVTAVATINDDGGIDITAPAGGSAPSTAPPPPAPDPVIASYTGTGSAVRPVDPITRPTIVRVTHDGAGAFSVQPQQGGVAAGEALLNVTGAADGRYLVGLGGTISGFAVTADGNWTLELHAIASAVPLAAGSPAAGDVPDVLSYTGADAGSVTVQYTGTTPIVIRAVTSAGVAVVIEEAGAFTGEVTLPPGPGNVLVDANGPWELAYPAPAPTTTIAAPSTTVAPTTTAGSATTAAAPTTTSVP